MLKSLIMGVLIFGSLVFLSSMLFAEDIDTKILRESAAALQESDPALSDDLKKFADEEAAEIEQKGDDNEELEGQAEVDRENHAKKHIELLNKSASALQKSNPSLAKQLKRMAADSAESMDDSNEGKEDTKDVEENEVNK